MGVLAQAEVLTTAQKNLAVLDRVNTDITGSTQTIINAVAAYLQVRTDQESDADDTTALNARRDAIVAAAKARVAAAPAATRTAVRQILTLIAAP